MDNKNELALAKEDFTLFGEARTGAVDENCNYNFVDGNGKNLFWHTYSIGDDITTYRGITIGSTIEEVFEKYGEMILLDFNPYNDYLLNNTILLHKDEYDNEKEISKDSLGDFRNIVGDEKWVEYHYADEQNEVVYYLKFYFNSDDKVLLIGYYNLSVEEASEKMMDDFYLRRNALYGPEYHVMYDIQYKLLPVLVFEANEELPKALNDKKRNFIYEFISGSYKAKLDEDCPYKPEDFEVSSKLLFVDDETFNLTTIRFNIEMKGVLSKAIYIVYDNKFKNKRYFTAEHDEFGDDESVIHFCEVYKDGRQNYGKMDYDEQAIEKKIIDIYTDKVITTGTITKYPKIKEKKKEININDKVWLGIRANNIKKWQNYEPESKIENVEGLLIFGIEVGSPFKECNLSFDTANFITKFDGVKITTADAFVELLKKYKPKDIVIVTIDSYDSDLDKFLSKEYKIVLSSQNEETYELVLDRDSITSKMNHYVSCMKNE